MNKIRHYFPGGNTPQGFFSYYDQVMPQAAAKRIIVLKGGPGTGKSTLMKKVAAKLIGQDFDVEMLHCSSDPGSLDGVVIQALGAWILDGTAPHVVDPINPGAVDEIINLGDYWDDVKIALHRDRIMASGQQISGYFASTYRYLRAAKSLQEQIASDYLSATDPSGVKTQLNLLFGKLDYPDSKNKYGKERKGFLSAFTPSGMLDYIKTYADNADEVYTIKSGIAYNSGEFFDQLRSHILAHGIDVYTFYCPMSPDTKIEHIYVPQTGQFFTTENAAHSADCTDAFCINLNQYVDTHKLDANTPADTETYNLLISRAIRSLEYAKTEHDVLESFYSPYMDFSRMDSLAEKIAEKFLD